MPLFYVDVENASGTKFGPLTTASVWRYTARMDRAGTFDFTMPASDPKAALVIKKRIARAYAYLDGAYVEVGAGIIDRIEKIVQDDGTVALKVSGDDLIRELTYRTVLTLKLSSGGNAITHAAAVALVDAVLTTPLDTWVFTPDPSPPNDLIYGQFNGETVLQAAIKLAEKAENHFYRGTGRSLIYSSEFTPSGIRAIQGVGRMPSHLCAINRLSEKIDTYDLITRIYPRGSGNAEVQLTLWPVSVAHAATLPAGYTFNRAANYIEYDAGVATYGQIDRQVDYREIGPVENTDADIRAAANALFDAALEELKRRSSELEQATYTIGLTGCKQLLRPMQSIRVVYKDSLAGLDIDQELNILETTWEISGEEVHTIGLVVSNADRWPPSDVGTIVDGIAEGKVYQALPQLSGNSYVTAYTKNIDAAHEATFRFRFGNEVTQLQQVLFEFQLLQFESTVRSIGGESSGSGNILTNPAEGDTGDPDNDLSGTPDIDESGGPDNDETGDPEGGDVISAGQHDHEVPVQDVTPTNGDGGTAALVWTTWDGFAGEWAFASATGDNRLIKVTPRGNHTHNLNSHKHDLGGHKHSLNGHVHDLGNHVHDLSEAIVAEYGVFREDLANTYEVDELQYNVNGLGWELLSDAVDVGDGWYALDITDQVQHDDTFRPLQENNQIVIRAASFTMGDWGGASIDTLPVDTIEEHGFEVGDFVNISGAPLSSISLDVNGVWEVIDVGSDFHFLAMRTGGFPLGPGEGTGGFVGMERTVTVDAQLSVRNIIQSIAYN